MKAMHCTRYGSPDVLRLRELEMPVPKDDEVLVKVVAASVTAGDCEMRRFKIPVLFWLPARIYMGITKPRRPILGMEFAGEIAATGKRVTQFKKGDAVFAATGIHFGAYAPYKCHPAAYAMALKPANISYGEAATIPIGGLSALHFLRKAKIQPGEKVLIYGATGSIGTYAVQLARHFGAEVTAVCSVPNLELVKTLGADHAIDYQLEDFTSNREGYAVIFDAIGKSSFSRSVKCLTKNGRYLLANPGFLQTVLGLWTSLTSSRKVILAPALEKTEDLVFLKELVEAGKLKPVIDRSYPLEALQEAHRYVEKGFKTGNVIITVAHARPEIAS